MVPETPPVQTLVGSPETADLPVQSSLKNHGLKIPLILLALIIFAAGGVAGGFYYRSQSNLVEIPSNPNPDTYEVSTPIPTATLVPSTTSIPTRIPTLVSPTTVPTKKPLPTPTNVPSPTATTAPQATSAPPPSGTSSCQIVANPSFGVAPLSVSLVYAATIKAEAYVTGIQWDYNGDGNWDSDMSINNGNVNYVYSTVGIVNPRMRIQISNGETTDPCTTSISVQDH